ESARHNTRGGFEVSDGWFATVYRENAYLPEVVAAAMDEAGIDSFQLHRNGGFIENIGTDPRRNQGEEKGVFGTFSWSVGVDAILPNGWDMRASWQKGRSKKRTGVYPNLR